MTAQAFATPPLALACLLERECQQGQHFTKMETLTWYTEIIPSHG